MIEPYRIACIQSHTKSVRGVGSNAIIKENLKSHLQMIDNLAADGVDGLGSRDLPGYERPRLVVFPEVHLQGFPYTQEFSYKTSLEEWLKMAIQIPGEETDEFAEKAQQYDLYIVGCAWEVDPEDWPERFFDTAFIISPEGKVILKYRKINTGYFSAISTTPRDILSKYIERYGWERLFPVVDTPLGKLGCLICYDICFPEVARCLALNGAEILLHPTGESSEMVKNQVQARRTRAFENVAYIASANHAGGVSGKIGRSEIIDYEGRTLVLADGAGLGWITAWIDINALRARRSQYFRNYILQLPTKMYAQLYQRTEAWPTDHWVEKPVKSIEEVDEYMRKIMERLRKRGIFETP